MLKIMTGKNGKTLFFHLPKQMLMILFKKVIDHLNAGNEVNPSTQILNQFNTRPLKNGVDIYDAQ